MNKDADRWFTPLSFADASAQFPSAVQKLEAQRRDRDGVKFLGSLDFALRNALWSFGVTATNRLYFYNTILFGVGGPRAYHYNGARWTWDNVAEIEAGVLNLAGECGEGIKT